MVYGHVHPASENEKFIHSITKLICPTNANEFPRRIINITISISWAIQIANNSVLL